MKEAVERKPGGDRSGIYGIPRAGREGERVRILACIVDDGKAKGCKWEPARRKEGRKAPRLRSIKWNI